MLIEVGNRPVLSRDFAPSRNRRVDAAQLIALASAMPVGLGRPVVGGGDWYGDAVAAAAQCVPPGIVQRTPGCGYNPADPCSQPQVGAAGISLVNTAAVTAGGAFSLSIAMTAPFKPLSIVLDPTTAPTLLFTAINYGPREPKLIGSPLSGAPMSSGTVRGSFMLPGNQWLMPGQTIVMTGTSTAAYAVGALVVTVQGVTPA